ncbi:hypothetical protein BDN71DRAFT_1432906 [Pleurotus eryngii]|uniref:Uncharacterized protein n=1 Tax=Pleurotus eryngii TaxID=5323 RepID=A0A9P6D4Z3_PLEER|nr:hypothetical protein BDN71DRAFT_1432906 [Pleurotus eryngii]
MSEDFHSTLDRPFKIKEGKCGHIQSGSLCHERNEGAIAARGGFSDVLHACLQASSSKDMNLGFKACKAFTGQSFLKGKHGVQLQRQMKGPPTDTPPVLACYMLHISLGSIANIPVDVPFGLSDTWLVEKMLISDKCNNPYISIQYLDAPQTEETLKRWTTTTKALRTILSNGLQMNSSKSDDYKNWGPKTTAIPKGPSNEDVLKVVNLGSNVPNEHCMFQVLAESEHAVV